MNKKIIINYENGYFTASLIALTPYPWEKETPQVLENLKAKRLTELYKLIEGLGWYKDLEKNI